MQFEFSSTLPPAEILFRWHKTISAPGHCYVFVKVTGALFVLQVVLGGAGEALLKTIKQPTILEVFPDQVLEDAQL